MSSCFSNQHEPLFIPTTEKNERRVKLVLTLTVVTMLVEIVAGTLLGSMALLADGWHMGTHAAAFGLTLFTYHFARKHANNREFSFGTGKVNYLGGFASAVALAMVAILMVVESVERLMDPVAIQYKEAMIVAAIGLAVNVASAFILHDDHHHSHDHNDHSHDHNLKAAYFHVLADALTSILAIVALGVGAWLSWTWLDAMIGIVGAVIIGKWAYGLIVESSAVLLDKSVPHEDIVNLAEKIEAEANTQVNDLHVWMIAEQRYAAILAVETEIHDLHYFRQLLQNHEPNISHITVEFR